MNSIQAFLEKLKAGQFSPLALGGIIIGGLIALLLIISVVGAILKSAFYGEEFGYAVSQVAPMMDGSYKSGYGGGMAVSEASYVGGDAYSMEYDAKLSARNVASIYPPSPMPTSVGNTAELFEVKQYSANYETGDTKKMCAGIFALKSKDYVIFENSNEYSRGCNYTFKVEKAYVEEILGILTVLKPKDLSQNIQTIKQQIDDFTAREAVLVNKRASVEQTLAKAVQAYDEVTALAVRSQNAEALASAINSKIQIIERLTQSKIDINEQLDQLSRAKTQQLDQVDYTFFSVSVSENKYVDWRSIGESWKYAIQKFINDINQMLQTLTLGMLALLLLVIQYAIYFFALVLIAKYSWMAVKAIWNR